MTETRSWRDIDPKDAVDLDLETDLTIDAPLNEVGERCPWPWEPQQLVGVPMGQYHCGYCGAMCVAGVPHPDYSDLIDGPCCTGCGPGCGCGCGGTDHES